MANWKRKRDSIHETPDVSYITNPDVAHEESDVAVRPLLWFVGGLTMFTIVVCAAVLLMFNFFQKREEAEELEPSPLARQGKERLPPEPRLQLAPGFRVVGEDGKEIDLSQTATRGFKQPQPESEYWVVRDHWKRQLEGYGWADQQAGTVRIPVSKAMEIYVSRQRAKQQAQPPQGAAQPQASGAGGGSGTPTQSQPSQSSSGQQPEQRHP